MVRRGTTREQRFQQAGAISQQIRTAREQLDAALTSMDYTQALEIQVRIDELERALAQVLPRDAHDLLHRATRLGKRGEKRTPSDTC